MASLLVENIPVPLLARLHERAAADQRTLDGQIIWLLEQALQQPSPPVTAATRCDPEAQLAAWRGLAGQWQGSATETAAVIADIYAARTGGREFAL